MFSYRYLTAASSIFLRFVKFTAGKDKDVTVARDKPKGYNATLEMNITPPKERNTVPFVSEEQAAENVRRFAYEDSLRNAYVSTFMTRDAAKQYALDLGFGDRSGDVAELFVKSRGNHAVIKKFFEIFAILATLFSIWVAFFPISDETRKISGIVFL